MAVYIYKLIDPRTLKARYIGKTIDPQKRYKGHLKERGHWPRHQWIKKLRELGMVPYISIVEELADDADWKFWERFWIDTFRHHGLADLNVTDGGQGFSPEEMRRFHAARTPEERSDIAKRGNAKLTPEQRSERVKKAQREKTFEMRQAIALKREAGISKETRHEAAKRREAAYTLEEKRERSERSRMNAIAANAGVRLAAWNADRSSEQRRQAARKGVANMTPEQLSARGKKVSETRARNKAKRLANSGSSVQS